MRNIALLFCCQICNNFIKKHQQQFVLGNPWCLCSFQKNSSSPPPFFGRLTDEEEERGRSKWKRRGRKKKRRRRRNVFHFLPLFQQLSFLHPLHSSSPFCNFSTSAGGNAKVRGVETSSFTPATDARNARNTKQRHCVSQLCFFFVSIIFR